MEDAILEESVLPRSYLSVRQQGRRTTNASDAHSTLHGIGRDEEGSSDTKKDLPTRLGLSGKNSDKTGTIQPCFLMIGFTRTATR